MGLGLSLMVAAALTGVTTPSGVELERVIDSGSYQPPGLPGQFFIERTLPLICGDAVIFAGMVATTRGSALYAATPEGVEVVANELTPIDATEELFHRAEEPTCDGDRVLFQGSAETFPHGLIGNSIYSWRSGSGLTRELAAGIDFGPIRAYSFRAASADGGDLVVSASLRQAGFQAGKGLVVKRQAQAPQLIFQDFTQILPGQATPPDSVGRAVLRDGSVYYGAQDAGHFGIYGWSSAAGFALLLDNQAIHPEIGGSFGAMGVAAAVAEGLIFGAAFSGGDGLFLLRADGIIETLLRSGDLTTEGQALREFSYVEGDASLFTFYGSTEDAPPFVDSAFVRTPDGRIQRILTSGETLEGQPVATVLPSANGREAAILVEHAGPSFATTIYRLVLGPTPAPVDVPALSPAAAAILSALLAAGGLLLLRRL